METSTSGLVTQDMITEIENKYSIKLPQDYVEYMLSVNGYVSAEDEKLIFPVFDTDMILAFSKLYGINVDEENDIVAVNEKYKELKDDNIFIIGECKDGGLLVINFYDGENSCICYWDVDLNMDLSSEDANAYLVTPDFEELLKIIVEENENEEGESIMETVNYLPLGSIVYLEGGIRKVMITSRGLVVDNHGRELFFDYAGVLYPRGLVGDEVIYFNHENIAKVVFEGFADDDDAVVVDNINKFILNNPKMEKGNPNNWTE